jgi:hypothetical protein
MSGRRSDLARKRRRRERRVFKQREQEVVRSIRDHGETTHDPKFDKPHSTPCFDCNLENRLRTTDLRPSPIGAIPLMPSRLSKWRPTASIGCETCGGTGKITLDPYEQVDPYDLTSRKESRESLEALRLWRLRAGKDFPPSRGGTTQSYGLRRTT